ncbi:adenylosuccinate lyase [uncultured Polaribacter sp.]|uniref:adenylosuccinate lyase n=1 Tax=uncultured Polaribacter sp. TaxID=174711 RepID=UPI00262E3622|nr:adenylosuccinate lyase [uncultured Polaribacter sp.]
MLNRDTLFVIHQLENLGTAGIENRQRVANIILANKMLFKELVTITFFVDDKISIKAAWILEWICTHHHLNWLSPHLKEFSKNIATLQFDSAIRPCAKICEHIATAYFSKEDSEIKNNLTETDINAIVNTGFDWLITPQKIAVRAYTMNVLYLFGQVQKWIHPELKYLIATKIIHESKGCKARGSQILKLIDK